MKNKISIKMGKKIKKLRQAQGLTQLALAEKLKKSRCLITQWESGTAIPTTIILPKLAKSLKVTTDDLYK